MRTPTPPSPHHSAPTGRSRTPRRGRALWTAVGLVVLATVALTPLVATVGPGSTEPTSTTGGAVPVAEFAAFDLEGDQSSLPWPSAAELEAFAAADRQARIERYVAALPAPPPAPAPAPVPTPTSTPGRAPEPTPVTSLPEAPGPPPVASDSVWDALAACESGGNWAMNSGNGFYGGVQFMHSTWVNMGGRQWAEYPHEASREQQIEVATRLQARYGWGQWPACSARLGLR